MEHFCTTKVFRGAASLANVPFAIAFTSLALVLRRNGDLLCLADSLAPSLMLENSPARIK